MNAAPSSTRDWILRALLLDKVVQHAFVTYALATDLGGIRDGLAVDYRWLVPSGAVVGALFAVALIAHLAGRRWHLYLAIGLALFDIIGEFFAQGTISIIVTVSFVVAVVILVLALLELRAGAEERYAASD